MRRSCRIAHRLFPGLRAGVVGLRIWLLVGCWIQKGLFASRTEVPRCRGARLFCPFQDLIGAFVLVYWCASALVMLHFASDER